MSREQQLLRTFVELADTLVDDFDALEFMHTLTERAVALLGVDAAGLILSDQRGDLQVVAATSHQADVLEVFWVQSSEGGPALESYRTGEQFVNLRVAEVADRWPKFEEACRRAGFRSSHAVPMRLRDQAIGALNLFCIDPSPLSDPDVALAQAMADTATIGLIQERVIRQREVLSEQLQRTLNSRLLIEQAKGVLAERSHISPDVAFGRLRAHARRTGQPLVTVAAAVVAGQLTVVDPVDDSDG